MNTIDWAEKYEKDFSYLRPPNRSKGTVGRVKNIARKRMFFHKNKGGKNADSFHKAIAPVLFMAQCFGLMPVQGIFAADPSGLSFSWFSLRAFYCYMILIIVTACCLLDFIMHLTEIAHYSAIVIEIFSIIILAASFNLVIIANRWPYLMKKWHKIETEMRKLSLQRNRNSLSIKVRAIAFIGFFCTVVELTLNYLSRVDIITDCFDDDDNFYQNYFKLFYPTFFKIFGFSKIYFIPLGIVYCIDFFFEYFVCVLIMMISVGLEMTIKSFNDSILIVRGKNVPETFWAKHRLYYREFRQLCENVDDTISVLTLCAFCINLSILLMSILKCFGNHVTLTHFISSWIPLIYHLARIWFLTIYSSRIHDESKRPLKILRLVPRESWCLETSRFYEEVGSSSNVNALSGMKLFYITREIFLSLAGLIVTYELVLIQMDSQFVGDPCLNFY